MREALAELEGEFIQAVYEEMWAGEPEEQEQA